MKKLVLLFFIQLSISQIGLSQNSTVYSKGLVFYKEVEEEQGPQVQEEEEWMSAGAKNAFTIDVEEGDLGFVAQVWKDYTSSRFNSATHFNKKEEEFYTKNAKVTPVTSYPINLIGKATKLADKVRFSLWLDMDGAFFKSEASPEKAEEVQAILEDFAIQVQKEKFRLLLVQEKLELEKLELHLHRLKKAKDRHEYELSQHDGRKDRLEVNLSENAEEQIQTQEAILRKQQEINDLRERLESI